MTRDNCPNCGVELDSGASACHRCGASLQWPSPEGTRTQVFEAPPPDPLRAQLEAATTGRFEIGPRLGQGGMATVYQALDLRLKRKVALKVMSPELLKDSGMVERFRREAQIIASLHHQHIVPVHSVEHLDDIHFFELRFVEGPTLRDLLEKVGPLPVDVVRAWFAQIAEALDYAHQRGVVHRDIKPGNILVELDGTAVITDFGIAKIEQAPRQTATGLLVGTTTYMSPEQWSGSGIGPASDQYSLGIVLYEMLTGNVPFSGNMHELLRSHLSEAPTALTKLRADCPRDLARAVTRMLEKDPDARWPNLTEAARAAEAVKPNLVDPVYSSLISLAQGDHRGEKASGSETSTTTSAGLRSTTTRITTAIRARPKTSAGVAVMAVALPLLLLSGAWPRGGVGDPPEPTPGQVGEQALSITPVSLQLMEGDSALLSTFLSSDEDTAQGPPVTFRSEAEAVARVDSSGWVFAMGPGETTVTAEAVDSDLYADASIVVREATGTEGEEGGGRGTEVDSGETASSDEPPRPDLGAASFSGVPDSILTEVGLSEPLTPVALNTAGEPIDTPVEARSADPEIARVERQGGAVAVRGVRPGRARVVLESGELRQEIVVLVAAEPIALLRIDPERLELEVGERATLQAQAQGVRGGSPIRPVDWVSTRSDIASVDLSGEVTGIGAGETRVIASSGGRADTSMVVVEANPAAEVSALEVGPLELFDPGSGTLAVRGTVALSLVGRDGSPWCVSATFRTEGGQTVHQSRGVTPGPAGEDEAVEFSVSLDDLGLERGASYETESVFSTVGVWDRGCGPEPPEGEALRSGSSAALCLEKRSRMARWGLCG